ncbi:NAD(P)H-dependent oxidoreductase [Polaribacter sp.]|nr:NAD(P)H-dependent oxidoreductase [Polaribacter sp.]MDA9092265.1 NAD(P)H-dependent oxidoreductase [Polaribacter sp.]MDB4010480.1 NAD(P)H-dependent oxidoreductase [Polaribacter sp.]MDB4181450.1 NAD(P)H-dependent oxidoreductase [Polaribacter sp.]
MNTIESLQWRYATKKFDATKKLSNTQINTLKEAFNLTATSYGLQPIKLVVIQNKKIQEKLVSASWNQQQIIQASHVLVICIQEDFTSKAVKNYFDLVKKTRNTPDEVLSSFRSFLVAEIDKKTPEELNIWNKNQAYLALGNLLTVCAVEQIDACPMEGFIPEQYDEILGLKAHGLTSTLVLPVGFRADEDAMQELAKVRKKLEDSIIEIS